MLLSISIHPVTAVFIAGILGNIENLFQEAFQVGLRFSEFFVNDFFELS